MLNLFKMSLCQGENRLKSSVSSGSKSYLITSGFRFNKNLLLSWSSELV